MWIQFTRVRIFRLYSRKTIHNSSFYFCWNEILPMEFVAVVLVISPASWYRLPIITSSPAVSFPLLRLESHLMSHIVCNCYPTINMCHTLTHATTEQCVTCVSSVTTCDTSVTACVASSECVVLMTVMFTDVVLAASQEVWSRRIYIHAASWYVYVLYTYTFCSWWLPSVACRFFLLAVAVVNTCSFNLFIPCCIQILYSSGSIVNFDNIRRALSFIIQNYHPKCNCWNSRLSLL